jgi:hypothetical protein
MFSEHVVNQPQVCLERVVGYWAGADSLVTRSVVQGMPYDGMSRLITIAVRYCQLHAPHELVSPPLLPRLLAALSAAAPPLLPLCPAPGLSMSTSGPEEESTAAVALLSAAAAAAAEGSWWGRCCCWWLSPRLLRGVSPPTLP